MRLRSALLLAPWLLTFALFVACDGQGEGQACTRLNGDSDCQSGLTCTPLTNGQTGARCCPANIGMSTTGVCGVQQNVNDADTPPSTSDAGEAGAAGDGSSEDATAVEASDEAAATDGASAATGDAAPTVDAASE